MMDNLIHLEACPFCGKQIEKYKLEVEKGFVLELVCYCENCEAEFTIKDEEARYAAMELDEVWASPIDLPKTRPIDRWNRRTCNGNVKPEQG